MSDGTLANHWPAADADNHNIQPVALADLADIVRRAVRGMGTADDRLRLNGAASEVEAGTMEPDLVALARQLRWIAKRVR